MKKIRFAAAMVLIISVLLLPACGGTPKTDDGTNSSTSSGEVDGAGKDLADDAKDVGDDMKDAAEDMVDGVADGAKDVGEGMADGVKKAADGVKDAVTTDGTKDNTNTAKDTAGTKQ